MTEQHRYEASAGDMPRDRDQSRPTMLDPNLDGAALAQLAQARPDLWPAIADHPHCYPGLRAWIAEQAGH